MVDTSTLINNALINKQIINTQFICICYTLLVMLSSLWCSLSFVVGVCSVSASDRFQGRELCPPLLKLLDQLLPLKLSRLLYHLPHKPSPNVHRPSHCLQVLENGIIVCREKEGERGRERERGGERGREGRPCSQSHLLGVNPEAWEVTPETLSLISPHNTQHVCLLTLSRFSYLLDDECLQLCVV